MDLDFSRTITRVALSSPVGYSEVDFLNGGQLEWTWAVGMPYRVLAGPKGIGVMPASPAELRPSHGIDFTDVAFGHGLGYFACLQSFLTYSFGWTRHDLGLYWWYGEGCPLADPRFALLNAVWHADGMLERYFAWCVERAPLDSPMGWCGEPLHPWAVNVNRDPAALSNEWSDRLARAVEVANAQPHYTQPWGKHLEHGDHIGAPSGWDWAGYGVKGAPRDLNDSARLVDADPGARRAVFISDHVGGWYAALAKHGASLPPLPGDRNWRIDVYVRPIGYLGEYRRSRTTGLWFAGHHRHHMVGN